MNKQKRKTITIASLTILAFLIAGLYVRFVWFADDVTERDPVALVSMAPFPCVLACCICIFVAMRRWSIRWFVKAGIVLLLVLPLLITGFVWGYMVCFFVCFPAI